jgi:tRNA nucleotidyltransferase (CCA-adding enzyme)
MLLHDIGKPQVKTVDERGIDHFKTHAAVSADMALGILERFKASNAVKDEVVTLVRYHQSIENVDEIRPKRWLSKLGAQYSLDLFAVRLADLKAHNPEKVGYEIARLQQLTSELEAIIAAGEAFRVSDLAIDGNDLISLGFSGREIGEKLSEILSLVVDDKLPNTREDILNYLNK